MNDTKKTLIATLVSILLTLSPVIAGYFLYSRLPEDLPIHYNISGIADKLTGKTMAILLLPLIMAVFTILMTAICFMIKPNFRVTVSLLIIGPLVSISLQAAMFCNALGKNVSEASVAITVVGIVCIILGNIVPTVRPNGLMGIRFPWIMDDDDLWDRTQRFGGKLLILLGAACVISAFTAPEKAVIAILIWGALLVALIAGIYSYAISR